METPKLFVGCCMVVLNPAGDKVLVAKRLKEPDKDGLQIPGGTIDFHDGDLPQTAAVREAFEETGIKVLGAEFLCLMNSFYYSAERPIHVGFVGRAESEELPPNPEPEKAGDWHWVPLNDLPDVKWFRMSRIAIDFYKRLQTEPNLSRYFQDQEYLTK